MPLTLESGQLPPEDRRVVIRDSKTGEFAVAYEPVTEKHEERRLTVDGLFSRLALCKFEVEERPIIIRLRIKTETGQVVLNGPSFNCEMLRELLALKAEGIEPFSCSWFGYDSDSCMNDPQESYSFFVVYENRIVREDVSFSDCHENGFDPSFFVSGDDPTPTWSNERGWWEATTRFWYRKFYTETRTGQLMIPLGNLEICPSWTMRMHFGSVLNA